MTVLHWSPLELDTERPTLLVVEDEEVIGLSLRDSLCEAGFEVQLFSNAATVLAAIDHITISAAVIDVGLPGMRGDQLARLCRARLPALPIILATGYDERRYASSAAADPLLAVLGKPFDTARLLIRLEELGVYATTGCGKPVELQPMSANHRGE